MENLYRVLGVPEDAAEDDLKLAYRKLAKKYHPDANPGDRECEKRFQAINEAYSILSSPEKRKKYDAEYRRFRAESGSAQMAGSAYGAGSASGAGSAHGAASEKEQASGIDFENIHRTFERFFGFNPDTKTVTNEQKLNPGARNPLDTTDLFERFMGIKR